MVASHTNPSTQAASQDDNHSQTDTNSVKLTSSTHSTTGQATQHQAERVQATQERIIHESTAQIQPNANSPVTHSVKDYLTSLNHALDKIRPQIQIPTMAALSEQSDLLSVKSTLNNLTHNTNETIPLYQQHNPNITADHLALANITTTKNQAAKTQTTKVLTTKVHTTKTRIAHKNTRQKSVVAEPVFSGTLFNAAEITLIHQFISHLSEAIFIIDAHGMIKHSNKKSAQLLACNQSAMIDKNWLSFLPEHIQTQYTYLLPEKESTLCPLQHSAKEMSLIKANGEIAEVELSISYLPCAEPLFVIALHDMTQHKLEYSKLRKLASTDCLTSLANRRYFDEMLQYYWDECSSKLRPLSVIIIDIDYFKVFNDQFGHIQGDECLRKIAKAIAEIVPSELGLAARYGGEEFALILPYHNTKMAIDVAKQVQDKINSLRFTDQGLRNYVSISASQGIASEINGQYRTSLAMLCAADTALYRAKADGRDRINTSL